MSTRSKVVIALLVALAVCIVLVAPRVDLPATTLESLAYAFAFYLLMRLPLCLPAVARVSRPVSLVSSADLPPLASASPADLLASLRC